MTSKNIYRSLPQFNIYFKLLFSKFILLPWNLVIGLEHKKLLSEITKEILLLKSHDIKRYLQVNAGV